MNWGYKLMLVFIAFGAFMGFMVYNCMQTPVSLVTPEYYKDELNYQQVIDGSSRANQLKDPVELKREPAYIQLQIPTFQQHRPEGNVWFYCVNDSKKDRKYALKTDEEGTQRFTLDAFRPGRYIAKIEWEAEGSNYYTEKEIIIP